MSESREPGYGGPDDDEREAFEAYGSEPEGEFDDLPETHLDDEAYEQFVQQELDEEGNPRGDPPVGLFLGLLIAVVLVAVLIVFL